MKSTPGPWISSYDYATKQICVQRGVGASQTICCMGPREPAAEANARLIAAAPMLLALCKRAHDELNALRGAGAMLKNPNILGELYNVVAIAENEL